MAALVNERMMVYVCAVRSYVCTNACDRWQKVYPKELTYTAVCKSAEVIDTGNGSDGEWWVPLSSLI